MFKNMSGNFIFFIHKSINQWFMKFLMGKFCKIINCTGCNMSSLKFLQNFKIKFSLFCQTNTASFFIRKKYLITSIFNFFNSIFIYLFSIVSVCPEQPEYKCGHSCSNKGKWYTNFKPSAEVYRIAFFLQDTH